jgi:hypothetical protein
MRQEREGVMARPTNPTPHPAACAQLIVGLTESSPVAGDRVTTANRASPRQPVQRNYPGSRFSFASSGAIKRITAGVKACRRPSPAGVSICWPGLHPPVKSIRTKRECSCRVGGCKPLTHDFGRLISPIRKLSQDLAASSDCRRSTWAWSAYRKSDPKT